MQFSEKLGEEIVKLGLTWFGEDAELKTQAKTISDLIEQQSTVLEKDTDEYERLDEQIIKSRELLRKMVAERMRDASDLWEVFLEHVQDTHDMREAIADQILDDAREQASKEKQTI